MRAGAVFLLIFAVVTAARLTHSGFLWADDNLPLASAIQVAHGKTLYRDVWFDKPPLVSWVDLAWGARDGWPLRLAGAIYVLLASLAAWAAARTRWSQREGLIAACLLAFFLTFGIPSAIIPLASDMLLIAPHLVAIWLAWRGRAFWSGVAAGIGLLASPKAVFVLAACALWTGRQTPWLVAGFLAPNLAAAGWMALQGSLGEYYRQVWQWGSIYASHTFVENPWKEGVLRTANWLGFHVALAAGAIAFFRVDRDRARWRDALWIAFALTGVILGLRFFPRYYFLLLAPMTLLAARGWTLIPRRRVATALLLLLLAIPLVRFGPRYVLLARDLVSGREPAWADLAIDRDSRRAAAKLRVLARPGDTLFVWGFRPDIFVYSGLPAGTRFLESQPISGVLADRHLFDTTAITPEFTAPCRRELLASHPTFVVDGLGLYNPTLALARQPWLQSWFAQYAEVDRTGSSLIYRIR